jgi:hypothetical protein
MLGPGWLSFASGSGPLMGSNENSNEFSGLRKGEEFFI